MTKHNLCNELINNLISDPDISDESIVVVHQFLTDLLFEFESQALGRLKRYDSQRERKIEPNLL